MRQYAAKENSGVIACAALEEELSQLDDEERDLFFAELGIAESGLDKLPRRVMICWLISFYRGEKESRAWRIKKGTKAPQAAGVIHSDFERGFIRAEVIDYPSLLECGSFAAAKAKGKLRSEGKDYVIKDGDVVEFRFNV